MGISAFEREDANFRLFYCASASLLPRFTARLGKFLTRLSNLDFDPFREEKLIKIHNILSAREPILFYEYLRPVFSLVPSPPRAVCAFIAGLTRTPNSG